MARAGQVIDNPITGERITFLKTSADTEGELLSVEVELPPRAKGVPLHYHLEQTERFEVLDGTLDVHAGAQDRLLRPGEVVEVPPRVLHRFGNDSDQPTRFRSEIRPPRRIETMLEATHGLARDGKTNRNSVPKNPFQLGLLVELSESYLPGPPIPIQQVIFGSLARLARLLGYSDEFPEYAGVSVAAPARAYLLVPGEGTGTLGPPDPEPSEAVAEPLASGPDKVLPLVSALWLLNSTIGARVAVKEGLPGEWVAGLYAGRDASAEFFKGGGTALSPGLPMMVAQALFAVLSTHGGWAGKTGAAGLTLLGAGGTVGVLAETITYRVFSPRTFDPAKAPIVSSAVVLSSLMTILGARRLLALRGRS
jgi:quercetin dioxygenase-like cupin family protein